MFVEKVIIIRIGGVDFHWDRMQSGDMVAGDMPSHPRGQQAWRIWRDYAPYDRRAGPSGFGP
jgi:hypothetical protein